MVQRKAAELLDCLRCNFCHQLLSEPVNVPECMHVMCKLCLLHNMPVGNSGNTCPVCRKAGITTVLGSAPFEKHRAHRDIVLENFVRGIFGPKAAGSGGAHIADKPTAPNVKHSPPPVVQPAGQTVEFHVRPATADRARYNVLELERPYLSVPVEAIGDDLLIYVRFQLGKDEALRPRIHLLQLFCRGQAINPSSSVQQMYEQLWRPFQEVEDLPDEMELTYTLGYDS